MKKTTIITGILGFVFVGVALWLKFAQGGAGFIWDMSESGSWLLPLVGFAALLDSINPCAFSILIITIGVFMSMGKSRKEILTLGGLYVFGIFAVYIGIGLGILNALHIFGVPHFMAKVAATILIGFGVAGIISELFPSFPIKLRIPQAAHRPIAAKLKRATPAAAFILGALVGLCEFPCTGGPYLLVLGLLHDQGTYLSGLGYLLFYNLVFILPLVVILTVAADERLLQKVKSWKTSEMKGAKQWASIAMIAAGLLMLLL